MRAAGLDRRTVLALAGAGIACAALPARAKEARRPIVIGHRGACALRPEHTLASYAKAITDGADFVEPDLVPTRDGVLVARHENNIADTTDVAARAEFAGRRTEKTIDGQKQVGWFTEDFTLAELKTLRARERMPKVRPANASCDGRFDVPTWAEIVDFVAAESSARGRPIGLVPELKHSTYFRGIGLPLEDRFLASIAAHGQLRRGPLIVQSFEIANLRYLRGKLGRPANLQLMQLTIGYPLPPADVAAAGGRTTFPEMMMPAGLADIAIYADILAPDTRALIPLDPSGRLGRPTPIIVDAHRAGLLVMPWTFRPENQFLPDALREGTDPNQRAPRGSVREIDAYLRAGIDGFFTDDPALGRAAVRAM